MTHQEQYRRFIYGMLAAAVTGLFFGCWLALKNQIPGQLYVTEAQEIPELFGYPLNTLVTEQILKPDGETFQNGETESDTNPETGRQAGADGSAGTGGDAGTGGEAGTGVDIGTGGEAGTSADAGLGGSSEENSKAGTGENAQPSEQRSVWQTADTRNTVEASASHGILEDVGESYQVAYMLFGKIPLKTASVTVVSRKCVYAGGTPVGIYMKTDGILVVDTASVKGVDGEKHAPSANVLKAGDYILAADGVKLESKEELIACVNQTNGEDILLDVVRGGETIQLKVTPVQTEEHDYKAGIWVRSDTQGIGTLTYVEESGKYGALGHGISDVDTGELLQIREGKLYDTDVISIVRGQQGSPGELAGVIHYSDGYLIGSIDQNQENGIYGTISGFPAMAETMQKYETAYKQEVKPGPAIILSSVDGICREYEIEIEEIRLNGKDINKGMVLKVTDQKLLGLTGGIVQGMSGSPIIQDGKLVGAVTHVLVNDPTRGYGIFIENMLEAAG